MPELLILKKPSWMDALTQEQIDEYVKKYPKFMDKYNARQQVGDIVDVKEDGHWLGKGRGYDKEVFDVVKVASLTLDQAMAYRTPLMEDSIVAEEAPKLIKKFRYNIASYTNEKVINTNTITDKNG